MLPDLGPRISLEDLLFSDYLGGSPAGIISISGSLSDLANGLLGGVQSGSLGNMHGGSLGNLQGGPMGGSLFGPNGPHGSGRVPPRRPIHSPSQGPSQRPSQRPSQGPPQGMSQGPAHLPTPEDGCGISPVRKSRIVGGVPAKNGAYPWMALLGNFAKNEDEHVDLIQQINKCILTSIQIQDTEAEIEYRSTAVSSHFVIHINFLNLPNRF